MQNEELEKLLTLTTQSEWSQFKDDIAATIENLRYQLEQEKEARDVAYLQGRIAQLRIFHAFDGYVQRMAGGDDVE